MACPGFLPRLYHQVLLLCSSNEELEQATVHGVVSCPTEGHASGSGEIKPRLPSAPSPNMGVKYGERHRDMLNSMGIRADNTGMATGNQPMNGNSASLQAHRLFRRHTYVAVDPFSLSIAQQLHDGGNATDLLVPPTHGHNEYLSPTPTASSSHKVPDTSAYIIAFLLGVLPRQLYLHLLLRLPTLYFSRVARVFEEAELSMSDIREMVIITENCSANWLRNPLTGSVIVPPNYIRLTAEWEYFINTLVKEWKTLNIVSILLLTAILANLQIDTAYNDPICRNAALLSLVCAMMSLLYGCVYVIRFNNMRKAHKAAEWAEEAQKTQTSIWWNVWVLLAMPSVWLSWSIISYLVCLFVFIWRIPNGDNDDVKRQLPPSAALSFRITITAVFGLGLVYFAFIVVTFRRYGAVMDRNWKRKMIEWVNMSESRESAVLEDTASDLQSMTGP